MSFIVEFVRTWGLRVGRSETISHTVKNLGFGCLGSLIFLMSSIDVLSANDFSKKAHLVIMYNSKLSDLYSSTRIKGGKTIELEGFEGKKDFGARGLKSEFSTSQNIYRTTENDLTIALNDRLGECNVGLKDINLLIRNEFLIQSQGDIRRRLRATKDQEFLVSTALIKNKSSVVEISPSKSGYLVTLRDMRGSSRKTKRFKKIKDVKYSAGETGFDAVHDPEATTKRIAKFICDNIRRE